MSATVRLLTLARSLVTSVVRGQIADTAAAAVRVRFGSGADVGGLRIECSLYFR